MSVVKCFVVGCSRSGTTLLSVLLDRHSAMAMTPETAFYRDLAIPLAAADRCRAMELISTWKRLPDLGIEADALVSACEDDLSPRRVVETMLRLYAAARGKRFCGEKTPGHWRPRCIASMLEDFPDAKILFLMRDGRDTALSLASMPFWHDGLAKAADLWIGAARACRQFLASHPDRVMLVRYEELTREPEAVLARVMAVLGLASEPDQLESAIASRVVLPRSEGWKGRALLAIDATRIGHWRQTSTPEEAVYLERTMRGELEQFGYSP